MKTCLIKSEKNEVPVFLAHRPCVGKINLVAVDNLEVRMLLSNFLLKNLYVDGVAEALMLSNRNTGQA